MPQQTPEQRKQYQTVRQVMAFLGLEHDKSKVVSVAGRNRLILALKGTDEEIIQKVRNVLTVEYQLESIEQYVKDLDNKKADFQAQIDEIEADKAEIQKGVPTEEEIRTP